MGAFRLVAIAAVAGGVAACATKKDVDRLRDELAALRVRQDTVAATVAELERSVSQALEAQQTLLVTVRGDLLRQLDDMERQLVEIQELLGQSQIVLQGLRERMEQRQVERVLGPEAVPPAGEAEPAGAARPEGVGGASPLYEAAMEQFRRGAYGTARAGFQEFLVTYPANELAPEAQYYVAETYREENDAEAALREYNRVIQLYPNSRAAPLALYKAGLLEKDRGNKDSACQYFQRVLAGFPRSDVSRLARDQAERLDCR
jgi:tol-pal system protein YbgF